MKKRLFSLLLVLALALSLGAAIHADALRFVYDENDQISAENEQILESLGARIYDDTGVAVCVYIAADASESDLRAFSESFYNEHIGAENGILLVHNFAGDDHRFSYFKTGDKLASLSDEDMTEIQQAYNSADTYFTGVRNYMNLVYSRLSGATAFGEVTPQDNPNIPEERQLPRVVDYAGVLDENSLTRLNALADQVSEKYQCDVDVVIVKSFEGKYAVDFADDFYDYNGYGYGPNDDGVMLVFSIDEREFDITTYGYGVTAFTDYGKDNYICPRFKEYLRGSRGGVDNWAGAIECFITDSGTLLEQARNGNPYDYHRPEAAKKSFKEAAPFAALISAVIGFFSGGIPTGAMKRQMKSVEKNYGAAHYARGGLNLRASDDSFLYANVSKTPIPRQTEHHGGGGGGSSVHFSSSGRTHGSTHGKF